MTKKRYLIVAIATLVTIALWVLFDVLHQRSEVKTTPEVEKLLEPINPNFNLDNL